MPLSVASRASTSSFLRQLSSKSMLLTVASSGAVKRHPLPPPREPDFDEFDVT